MKLSLVITDIETWQKIMIAFLSSSHYFDKTHIKDIINSNECEQEGYSSVEECSPCKHNVLSWNTQHTCRKAGMPTSVCNPWCCGWCHTSGEAHWSASLAKMIVRFSKGPCLYRIRRRDR